MRSVAIAIALGIAVAARVAEAEPTWTTTRGARTVGRDPGSFILYTDATPGRFSEGAVISKQPIRLPFRLDVTWRRLGPEAGRSMHLTVAGGVVLIKSGKLAFWAYDDVAFTKAGWRSVTGLRAHDEHAVSVVQDHREIVVSIDGAEAARFPFVMTMETAHIGVGMKGATGHRTAIFVRTLAVHGSSQ